MGLKYFYIDFAELSRDFFLRSDYDYFEIKNKLKLDKTPKLKKYLTFLETGKPITPEDYSEDETDNIHIVVRNIVEGNFKENNLIYISDEKAEELEKFRIEKDDIVIAISSNCGFSFYYDGNDKRNLTLSHYLARFKVNLDLINPIFLNYYINSKILKQYFRSVETGKTLKNLSKYYIKELPVLISDKEKQDQIVAQIEPIEQRIKELKAALKDPQLIINEVFAREFGFDLEKFEELKKQKFFEVEFVGINTPLIRSTVIQNKISTNYLKAFLSARSIFLKDIILKPIKRGIQPEYTEDGVKVIKTLNIQNGQILFDEVQFVSKDFFKKNEEKAGVYKNDLLLTSTGMGRGKFALYEEEESCLADSHISIIRFNQKRIDPKFLNYYCQSFLGVEQLKYIEIHIKGTPEIYEEQLKYFQIPNIPLSEQQRIVDEIKAELDKQEAIKKQIEEERNKIDEIIERAVLD